MSQLKFARIPSLWWSLLNLCVILFLLDLFENRRGEIDSSSWSHGLTFVEVHKRLRTRIILYLKDCYLFEGLLLLCQVCLVVVCFFEDLHLVLIYCAFEIILALTRFYDHVHSFIVAFCHGTQTIHKAIHQLAELLEIHDEPSILIWKHAYFSLNLRDTKFEVVDVVKFDTYSERWQINVVNSWLEFPSFDFSMLNRGVPNIQDIILFDFRFQVFADIIVHNLHELLLFDGEPCDRLVRLIKEFWNLIMETGEISADAFRVF